VTITQERSPVHPGPVPDLLREHQGLLRRHRAELHLADAVAEGGGISGLVRAADELTANPLWLIDPRRRLVARSRGSLGSDFRTPDLDLLLGHAGPLELTAPQPQVVAPQPAQGIARRHLLVPITRSGCLFAWLVVAEVSARFTRDEVALAARVAFHLAGEYAVQRRVARASWNARSALARQLVRGSVRDDDLASTAEYLGVRADASRVLVYIADGPDGDSGDEERLSQRIAGDLGVEVLGTRGREGTILLVEAAEDAAGVSFVQRVKRTVRQVLVELGQPSSVVGVSAVTRPGALQRSYRETREVALCVDRFARSGDRVIAVDDLGPARLFVANSDVGSVRRYVRDVLGSLLTDGTGHADLLRTLQSFFDTGRSVRESAARLRVHENTVRLRLAKVHDLTGLDVAGNANDQLSAQTALLVLRLEGHPAIPPFDERRTPLHDVEEDSA
jgi:hypothetical protein